MVKIKNAKINSFGKFEPKVGEVFSLDQRVLKCVLPPNQDVVDCCLCELHGSGACNWMACCPSERRDNIMCHFVNA